MTFRGRQALSFLNEAALFDDRLKPKPRHDLKPQKHYRSMIHLDFETVLKLNEIERKDCKAKGKEWIHFKDATGHWDETIQTAFRLYQPVPKAVPKMQELAISSRCIMGKTFDNNNPWTDDGYGYGCSRSHCDDCHWIATEGLELFSNHEPNNLLPKVPTSKEGYEEYKAKWEYHMNTPHR